MEPRTQSFAKLKWFVGEIGIGKRTMGYACLLVAESFKFWRF